jgi:hypothetical protein
MERDISQNRVAWFVLEVHILKLNRQIHLGRQSRAVDSLVFLGLQQNLVGTLQTRQRLYKPVPQ